MKTPTFLICSLLLLSLMFAGCTSSQQTNTYKTLYGLEVATSAAYDAYSTEIIAGKVATNDLPKVSHAFDYFQSGMRLAVDAAQSNSNALAPSSLVIESQDIINIISTIKGVK